MSNIYINKVAAAQRQIDFAIRALFDDKDALVVHTVASAAVHILRNLAQKRSSDMSRLHVNALARTLELLASEHGSNMRKDWFSKNRKDMEKWIFGRLNEASNFLKHADRDADDLLDLDKLDNDDLLLEACALYREIAKALTPEMWAFSRWHLAIYPSEPGDKIPPSNEVTDETEQLHRRSRKEQLEAGCELLDYIDHAVKDS